MAIMVTHSDGAAVTTWRMIRAKRVPALEVARSVFPGGVAPCYTITRITTMLTMLTMLTTTTTTTTRVDSQSR
ncbi:hypothetical protein V1478_003230 [Vespula squamosa]|uniref:Uncharacterized protein n=1 Tax=Vespula squamosa TaxID=30214 RepID=A0ABD2BS39_VESSQ